MKNLKRLMIVALLGVISYGAFSAYDYMTLSDTERLIIANVEALTEPEPGGGGAWSDLRLKTVNCTCPNGKTGNSLRCRKDGDKERCSDTQQGSTGCYSMTGSLKCEGSGVKFAGE